MSDEKPKRVRTETRYLATHLFWHFIFDCYVQVGEEYRMDVPGKNVSGNAIRYPDEIKGYIDRGELIPFKAPVDAPRVVFCTKPATMEWDVEKEAFVEVFHWSEAAKQWDAGTQFVERSEYVTE